ncbi:hypothetical protein R1sor_004800 [Riccia sorocarpa]|uniref:Uncharacterized protein n=1 Tax=Riccia sorocarpa TaxID=122646 RepID=A0ABD3HLM3_9MARC
MFVGKRLPSIRLMEAELTEQFASAVHGFLKKIAQFVSYTFKKLRDVDLVEFSAMSVMNILKVCHRASAPLYPKGYFLRKLVNRKPYEEISYYKEMAPYGPTYFLMTVIAELFWCNGRSKRFTTPMVYAYMRLVHRFQTNWAKVILHCLKTDICFLQKHAVPPTTQR